jgi:short-subunit dehydrogenase
MRIRGTIAVVTGASSGIGRETALALASQGASVVLAARRRPLLESLAVEIESRGGRALVVPTDVADVSAVESLAAAVHGEFGRCDILVNNAGIPAYGPFTDISPEDIEYVVRVNLLGVLHGTRVFLPGMLEAGSGHIVNVASLAGRQAVPRGSVYAATKHAVVGFSESVFYEVRDQGVRVTAINPGWVETPGFPQDHLDRRMVMWPRQVSAAIVRAIQRNAGPQVSVPRAGGMLEAFRVVTPGPYRWVMQRVVMPRHRPPTSDHTGGDREAPDH